MNTGIDDTQIKYRICPYGDCEDKMRRNHTFDSLEAALRWLEKWCGKYDDGTPGKLDIEDDRVTIEEILPTGHKKVVWHFSGWHWDYDEFGEQDSFIGQEKSVYALLSQGLA
jgi:hypothetical protein